MYIFHLQSIQFVFNWSLAQILFKMVNGNKGKYGKTRCVGQAREFLNANPKWSQALPLSEYEFLNANPKWSQALPLSEYASTLFYIYKSISIQTNLIQNYSLQTILF